jgi:cell division septum initiation protein DivIVA
VENNRSARFLHESKIEATAGARETMAENTDILRMLQELHAQIVEKPRYVGTLAYGINRDEVSIQIAKIRASLPTELKQASAKVRESEKLVDTAKEDANATIEVARRDAERLLNEAKKEVERALEQAKVQQERLVSESEVLKLSKAQAEEIRNAADRDANQVRRGAEKYARDVLVQLEGVVGKVMSAVEKGRQELERVPETAVVQTKEKARA